MSKDPAILFYTADFLAGTMFMSDEQVGQYMRLLCAQHQMGHLSEEDMLKICKSYDKDIFRKFKKDADGFFFNERLEAEINRRKAYSESRSQNRKQKNKDMKNICNSYEEHMENETITITETINKKKKEGVQGEKKTSYAEFVTLTPKEYDKLVHEYGEEGTKRMIEILNTYKGSSGKKYKSDYFTILKWVVDRWKQEQPPSPYKGVTNRV